jgi:hypothetical protein
MKKVSRLFVVATSLATMSLSFSSCDKLKDAVGVKDIFATSKDIPFDIPPAAAGSQLQSADASFNVDSIIKAGAPGFSANNIKSATVNSISVDITSGASVNNNFANFSDGGVAMYSNAAPTKVSVGQVLNNPDVYSTHMDIPITGTNDLTPYVKGSLITYLYGYTLRRATTTTLHVVMHVQYKLGVGL